VAEVEEAEAEAGVAAGVGTTAAPAATSAPRSTTPWRVPADPSTVGTASRLVGVAAIIATSFTTVAVAAVAVPIPAAAT
jgi:hypothetical protein